MASTGEPSISESVSPAPMPGRLPGWVDAMISQRLALMFIVIFLIAAVPLLLVQSMGGASAGLSYGFLYPLGKFKHIALYLVLGLVASLLKSPSNFLLPVAFLLMMLIGTSMDLQEQSALPYAKPLMMGAIIAFGLIASSMRIMDFVIAAILISIMAFALGTDYAAEMPDIASPLHYILGVILAMTFLIIGGVCLGMTLSGFCMSYLLPFRSVPPFIGFRRYFIRYRRQQAALKRKRGGML